MANFTDNFNGGSLDTTYWTGTGGYTVTGGNLVFNNGVASTLGKLNFSNRKIVVEFRASGVGTGHDVQVTLSTGAGGIGVNETDYLNEGFVAATSGPFGSYRDTSAGGPSNDFLEYRITLNEISATFQRGPTLDTLNETYTHTLSTSIASYSFYVVIQSGGVDYPKATFDYITIKDSFPPVVSTQAVSNIGITTATANGNVTSDEGSIVIERGVVWSTTPSPTTSNFKAIVSGTTGVFDASMANLTANTTYYVRAYATNSNGTTYGEEVQFTSLAAAANQIVKDIDGVEGQTYAVQLNIGGTTGNVTVKLGTTGGSQIFAAGAGTVTFQGIYGGLNGLIIEADTTFNGYVDNVYYVLVLGEATIDWGLDNLTTVYPINSSVTFRRIESGDFNRFRIYRYLDVSFKDLNAYVTVLLTKEANQELSTGSKEFLVSNVTGETLPFINKKISTLFKSQAVRIGFSNNRLSENFTICQFIVKGTQAPPKQFSGGKIISVV